MSIITPSKNRLLVKPIEDKVDMIGGIHIPPSAVKRGGVNGSIRAKVIAAGEGKRGYCQNDIVIVQSFDASPVHVDGEDYLLVSESAVLATIKA